MADLELMSGEPPQQAGAPHSFAGRRSLSVAELLVGLLLLVVAALAGRILLIAFGGLLLGVFFYSIGKWLATATRLPYGIALTIVMVALLSLAVFVFSLVGSRLARQANELTDALSGSLIQIRDYLNEYQWGQRILEQSPDWAKAIAQGNIPSRISDLASSIVDILISVALMIVIGLYYAAEPNTYANGLLRLAPIPSRPRAQEILRVLVYNLRWWILGQLFAMVCVGLVTGTGLYIAGTPLALTLGVLAAILEIIPNIGPVLWLVPAMLVALTADTTQVIRVAVIYGVTHLVESYIIIPLVQRRTVWLPPVLSILAVVILGTFYGFLGLLVASPLALVIMLLVKMLYVEDWLGDSTLDVSGETKR